ncbi:MAG: 30S ribosomal protein S1 [Planctomycetaceae bacterium]|jgi:small subunit ribosomal protein S1|nr:30S ribosomal protein S1 [Planctomycetaceae bacterium]
MVKQNLIRELDLNENNWDTAVDAALCGSPMETNDWGGRELVGNQIAEGKIVRIDEDFVVVDIGYKSEGIVPVTDWEEGETPVIGEVVKVLIEEEDEDAPVKDHKGMVRLSKRKAAKIEAWDNMMKTVKENDIVNGMVLRKIKGGLLVDIGVPVFLPASQVDVRRPNEIGEYVGKEIQCMVLKIDEERRNIVVSRRAMIESERAEKKTALLSQLNEGEIRKGIVKNIAEFGAFIDLGGIDGLLHITDMSWGRINHPSEMVKLDEEIEVVILSINREKEKISLGLKQKEPSPWDAVEERYPVGLRMTGTVVNVMNYGAFIKLEEGIEGLVHISEMSWTKRVNHPNEVLNTGDEVEVVVLQINKERQEISLGIKQTQENPWEQVDERYPTGKEVKGVIRNLTNYGAFVEIEDGIDGLLHVSDISWVKKITHPNEVLTKGQEITCKVLSVDKKNHRIALGLKQMEDDPWEKIIPEKYQPGKLVQGTVTKITNFGVFINLEEDLEGLLHISELANQKVDNPEEIVKVGEVIEVKVLRVDIDDRKIGLSRKRAEWSAEEEAAEAESQTNVSSQNIAPENLKGGVGQSGPLFK